MLLHSQSDWAEKICRFKKIKSLSTGRLWEPLLTQYFSPEHSLKKHPVPVSLCLSRQKNFSFQLHRSETFWNFHALASRLIQRKYSFCSQSTNFPLTSGETRSLWGAGTPPALGAACPALGGSQDWRVPDTPLQR